MSIPVQNIYHLLTYAWNQLEEAEQVSVEADPADDLLDLFARVLARGCTYLLKKGLDRGYVPHEEITSRLRGKILFNETLRQDQLRSARATCTFDEFSYNVLHNQIIKATLHHLLTREKLAHALHEQIKPLYQKLADVQLVKINMRDFYNIRLHRNNSHYRLLLHICQMIWEEVVNREDKGGRLFRDFQRDQKAMAALFEKFILNFYRHHLKELKIWPESIAWQLEPLTPEAAAHLPGMRTDVSIAARDWKIILDCKYYRNALKERFGKPRINSNHLYQLTAYLRNLRPQIQLPLFGILLYPVVEKPFEFVYDAPDTNGFLKICTVNLNQHWKKVEEDLRMIIENSIYYLNKRVAAA